MLAQDLFQETVIRFWKGLPSFQGGSKLSTWLYRIAYRVCLDSLTGSAARNESESLDEKLESVGFEPEDEGASGALIEDRIAASEAINRGLNKLPAEWRAMLMLFYWQGLSVEEIAQVSDRNVNTVKVYLHRARGALRKHLEEGGYPHDN